MKGLLSTTTEALSQGTLNKRLTGNLKSRSILDMYQDNTHQVEVEKDTMEEMKKEWNFKSLEKKDKGYFILFEHENEAQEMLKNKWSQMIVPDLLEEREVRLPAFFGFETLNSMGNGKLGEQLFSLMSGMKNQKCDMHTLKKLMLRVRMVCFTILVFRATSCANSN